METLISNIAYLSNNWTKIVDDFFMSFGDEFISIVQSQLQKGEDGEGKKLTKLAGSFYGKDKSSYPYPNLYDTGAFYRGMLFTEFDEIVSSDWKMPKLEAKYGDSILDPQEKELLKLLDSKMIPQFETYIETLLLKDV